MLLPTRTRRAILAAGVALAAAVTAASAISALEGPTAAAATAAGPTTSAAEPIITPLAAALIPGPIDIDRKGRSDKSSRHCPPRLQAG